MMKTILYILAWLAMLIVATPAFAYTPHVGDRAAPLAGVAVDGSTVDLDDFRGKWIVLEFWSTTCGPCIRQMPALREVTSQYRDEGSLELLLVNLNKKEMIPDAKSFVLENEIDCPVIIGGNASILIGPEPIEEYQDYIAPVAMAWSIRHLPTCVVINPDGVIVAKHLKPQQLEELLAFLIDGNDYLSSNVGCRSSVQMADNGQGYLLVDLWSPGRKPLTVSVNFTFIEATTIEYHGFTIPTRRKYIKSNPDDNDYFETVTFNDETSSLLKIPISMDDYPGIQYKILVMVPGTENLDNGAGIWTRQSGNFWIDFPTYSYESS